MFIETQEYGRFREFCDACRTYQYIGLCYGFPGVGKTLSARYYTDPKKLLPPFYWPSEANFEKGLESHVVLYTPPVANSPGRVRIGPQQVAPLRQHDLGESFPE